MNTSTATPYPPRSQRRGLRAARYAASVALALGSLLPAAATANGSGQNADQDDSLIAATRSRTPHATLYRMARGDRDQVRVSAAFSTFAGEPLQIDFSLDTDDSAASIREFGVSPDELEALAQSCIAAGDCDQSRFDVHLTHYYRSHAMGLRYTGANQAPRLYVDVPQVVQRNQLRVQPVAHALRALAARHGRDRQWAADAALALVQTGLDYRKPSMWEDGRKILGFYPPPVALERGYGDCDTKSALLAAILKNIDPSLRIIGVHIPGHYLLGVARTPRADEAFIEHEGRTYVLIEPSGPAKLRPGRVARKTEVALNRMEGVRIDPMF